MRIVQELKDREEKRMSHLASMMDTGQMEIRTTLEQVEHNVKALIQEKHDALELRGEYKHPKAGPRSCMSPDGRAEHKRVFSKAEGE